MCSEEHGVIGSKDTYSFFVSETAGKFVFFVVENDVVLCLDATQKSMFLLETVEKLT